MSFVLSLASWEKLEARMSLPGQRPYSRPWPSSKLSAWSVRDAKQALYLVLQMAGPSQRYQPSVAKPLRQLGVQTYGQKWYNINDRKPLGPRIPLLSAQGWVWTRSKDLQARSLQDCAYLSKPRNLRPNSGSGYAQAHAPRETLHG